MSVIKELRKVTKITKQEEALNRKIAETFTVEEQHLLYSTVQDLLFDEMIHVMAIMTLENNIKREIES